MFCIIWTFYGRDRRESAKSRKPTKAQYTVDGIIYALLFESSTEKNLGRAELIFYVCIYAELPRIVVKL